MNRRNFLIQTASSTGLLFPATYCLAASPKAAELPVAGGASAIFQDDFRGVEMTMPDGPKKLYPDTSRWAFTFWPGTKWPDSYGDGTNWLAGNAECQTYVTPLISKIKGKPVPMDLRYDPFSIHSDGLHIKAALLNAAQQSAYQVGGYRRFGSGMLLSRKTFTYGRISMVAKLPSARGSWPGFWLLPESHQWPPELDIFECMPWGKHQQQLHYGVIVPKGTTGGGGKWADVGAELSADFHQYDFDWTPETLAASIDGKVYWKQPTPPALHEDMYLIINFAVGGKWPFNELDVQPIDSVAPDRLSLGADLIQSDYPAEMIVKSVRVSAMES
jgi:hypothetical protein